MSRIKDIVLDAFMRACALLRHAGGCGLTSTHFYLFYDDTRADFRATVRNPLYRLFFWSLDVDNDAKWTFYDPAQWEDDLA